jgi:AcrR family transcriptional regulator
MSRIHEKAKIVSVRATPAGKGTHMPALGRRQRRAAETRLKLFRCALELIAEHGLPNVTVEDITEAADVLGVMAEIQLGNVKEAASRAALGKQTIQTVLRQLAHRLTDEPGRSSALARALISSFLGSESVREILKRTMLEGRKTVGEILAMGQERGQVDPKLKQGKLAMQFFQSVMGTVLMWSLHESPALDGWIDDSFQHFWRAVAVSGEEQEP